MRTKLKIFGFLGEKRTQLLLQYFVESLALCANQRAIFDLNFLSFHRCYLLFFHQLNLNVCELVKVKIGVFLIVVFRLVNGQGEQLYFLGI